MIVLEKDNTIFFDVDKTLIGDMYNSYEACELGITHKFNYYGQTVYCQPIYEHIRFLRASVGRNRNVVIWSANGALWAAEVLRVLKLDDLDVTVMSKGSTYVDDKDVTEFMFDRIYFSEKK